MECPKCKANIMDGSTLCVKCGANLKELNNVVEEVQNTNEVVETPIETTPQEIEEVKEVIETPTIESITPEEEFSPIEEVASEQPKEDIVTIEENKVENIEEQVTPVEEAQVVTPTVEEIPATPVVEEAPQSSQEPTAQKEQPKFTASVTADLNTEPKKSNGLKIVLFIIIGIVLVCIIGYGVSKLLSNKGNEPTKAPTVASTESLILIKKDDKYGYIDTEGNIIIPFEYESATEFYGDYALFYRQEEVQDEGSTSTRKAIVYYIIDVKGDIKLKTVSAPYITNYNKYFETAGKWIFGGKIYDSNLKQLSPNNVNVILNTTYATEIDYLPFVDTTNNQAGIIKLDGNVIYKTELDPSLLSTAYKISYTKKNPKQKDTYCSFVIDYKKSTIINCETGKVILDFVDHQISTVSNNIFYYSEPVSNTYNYAYTYMYIENDKIVLQLEPAVGSSMYYDGLGYLIVTEKEDANKYYYIIKTGEKTTEMPTRESLGISDAIEIETPTTVQDPWELLSGYTKYSCGKGYGLKEGEKEVLACDYYKINYLPIEMYKLLKSKGKDYVVVAKNDIWHVLDIKTGKIIFDMGKTYPTLDENNVLLTYKDENNIKHVINLLTGKTMEIEEESTISIYSNYFTVRKVNTKEYYNNNFKLIYSE